MSKIAIVEDDLDLSNQMTKMLTRYNYEIDQIQDFQNVPVRVLESQPDLVLLDINLPYFDGYHILREIRSQSEIPILFISARSSDFEQIMGLELGADDYVVKPFSMEMLHAKIKNCLRRMERISPSERIVNDVFLDKKTFCLQKGEKSEELTKNEYKILSVLLENANGYVSREFLLREIWDEEYYVNDNTLNVNVSRVKNKLAAMGLHECIKTKRGLGYMLDLQREGLK